MTRRQRGLVTYPHSNEHASGAGAARGTAAGTSAAAAAAADDVDGAATSAGLLTMALSIEA